MARRKGGAHGGHGWFVTFADLMGLLLSFFVVVVASSTQEKEKMLAIAGSFREAFGTVEASRMAGVIERDGLPTRNETKNLSSDLDKGSDVTTPREEGATESEISARNSGNASDELIRTEMAIRQALQTDTTLADLADQIVFEERPDGLAIEIVDQDGRSMFADGSTTPNVRIEEALTAISRELRGLPNLITITGHTASREGNGQILRDKAWEVSTVRALRVREIMAANGVSYSRFREVSGRADGDPYFPDDPSLARNRRVTLLIHDAGSVVPPAFTP
jgi:chemotaxis protein MotB